MSVPEAGTASAALPIEFRGSSREYFGIWIVNVLLTLLTLGIWSAWAKVRRKRYFLGSTLLAGDAFEYHATGVQILKGRLIVVAALIAMALVQQFYPLVGGALYIPLLLFVPWIANQSLRFNARMTSWRSVRFDFSGRYGKALLAFVLFPALGALSFGLLYPLAARYAGAYVARNYLFGATTVEAAPRVGPFYMAAIQAVGVAVLIAAIPVLLGMALAGIGALRAANAQGADSPEMGQFSVWHWLLLALIPGFFVAQFFYMARVRNIVVNAMVLGQGHRFRSDLSGLPFAWIVVTNFLLTVVSLGLLRPWAVVRQYRYQAACLSVLPAGDLDGFVDVNRKKGSVVGSEYADIGGFDFGF